LILQSGGAVPLPESLFHPGPTLWVQDFFGPRFEIPFRAVSELGISWGAIFAVGLALWTWDRRDAHALVGMSAVSAAASVVMNWLFQVPRPSHPALVKYEHVELGSFPSGHVFLATVLWGVLFARGRVRGWTLAGVIAGVSASRLFLGVHYLVDVIGGALFALAVVAAYHPLWKRLEERLRRLSFGVYLAGGLLVVLAAIVGAIAGAYGTNPFQWHSAGLAAGGAAALLLEHRFVRYEPAPAGALPRGARIALGLAGLAALVVAGHAAGDEAYLLGAVLVAVGALWALLAVPLILSRVEGPGGRAGLRRPGGVA
jgi:membrane-associated phospholipid phosphatase